MERRRSTTRSGGIGGGEGEEDTMCVSGAVSCIGIRAESQRVEDALDVVLLDGREEGFVGRRVVREAGGDGLHVCSIDVFGCNEFEPAVAVGVCGGFETCLEGGFPDHVAYTVAYEEEEFDDIGGK